MVSIIIDVCVKYGGGLQKNSGLGAWRRKDATNKVTLRKALKDKPLEKMIESGP